MKTLFTEEHRRGLREVAKFVTPNSLVNAKSLLRRTRKNIKKAEADRADAAKAKYDWGVKAADERLAELRAAEEHFEKWIAAQGGVVKGKPAGPKWVKQQLTVPGAMRHVGVAGGGVKATPTQVQGVVLGSWGVYKVPREGGMLGTHPWAVVHVPSKQEVVSLIRTQKLAKADVERLIEAKPELLNADLETVKQHLAYVKAWRDRIQDRRFRA